MTRSRDSTSSKPAGAAGQAARVRGLSRDAPDMESLTFAGGKLPAGAPAVATRFSRPCVGRPWPPFLAPSSWSGAVARVRSARG